MRTTGLLIVCVIFLLLLSCDGPKKADQKSVAASMGKVQGSGECLECHGSEYKKWEDSHHAKAMQHVADSTVLGNFNNIEVALGGGTTRFSKRDGSFIINAESGDGTHKDFEVKYTFGVYPLQQYLVELDKGKIQAFRLAWDVDKKEWYDLYPEQEIIPQDWLHWTRGGLNWNTMCAECHSTNVEKSYNPKTFSYNTTYDLENVSCESCHGAGEEHLKWAREGLKGDDKFIILPEEPKDQIRSCAPCHSRKGNIGSAFTFTGDMLDHFIPEILVDGLYHSDGQINDEVYVYGSFVQSRMHEEGVKCTDCHDVHSLKLKFEGNELCLQCHDKEYDQESHSFHKKGTEAALCISCHMTGKTYMGIDFRRDHSFRIPRPDQSAEYGTPNACNTCHTDETPQWAAGMIREWHGSERAYHFSDALNIGRLRIPAAVEPLSKLLSDHTQPDIARATAAYYLADIPVMESYNALMGNTKDSSSLVRYYTLSSMVNLPEEQRIQVAAPMLQDSIKGVRIEAAEVLADIAVDKIPKEYQNAYTRAVIEYEKMLEYRLDFPMGRFMAGQYEFRRGNIEKAISRYREALQMDTLLHIARENLARIYNQQGKNKEAVSLLETTISLDETNGQAYYSLGLIKAEEGDLQAAADLLEKAVTHDPYNERAYYNWGLSLQHLDKPDEAEKVYVKALEVLPSSTNIRHALSILYLQQGQKEKARPLVEELKNAFPNDESVQQLVEALR